MRKIAFFVEGATEQLFITKFFEAVCNKESLSISAIKGKGGGKLSISFTTISAQSITDKTEYFVLIVDCSGESKIASYIKDRRAGLIDNGYEKIVGIRDVFPNISRNQIPSLLKGLYYGMPQVPIRTDFILAVMETEAWFLSEHTHFTNINPILDSNLVKSKLGFDPANDDMEQRESPAADLNAAYQLVGENYTKDLKVIQRTISALDYAQLYLNPKVNGIKSIISEINSFISR